VIANEVLDALPIHRLVYRDGNFWEIRVAWEEGPVEVITPLTGDPLLEQARRDCPAPREGQEVEVGWEAHRWIRRLSSRLERGYAILMDYGYLPRSITLPATIAARSWPTIAMQSGSGIWRESDVRISRPT
jgi:SAM-dependent MidA family methyltransferase